MDARWLNDTFSDIDAEPIEARRALRRAAAVACELCSHYGDEPEPYFASDISPFGMWIDTAMPLHPGAEVVVGFRPPGGGAEVLVFATVVRAVTGRRRGDRGPLGMAVEFSDLSTEERVRVARSLMGIAPRLCREAA